MRACVKATKARYERENRAKAEDYLFLIETGCTHPEMLAKRLGYRSVNSLQAWVRTHGLPWVEREVAA